MRAQLLIAVLLCGLLAGVLCRPGLAQAQAAPRVVAPIYPLEHAVDVDGKITDWEWAPSLGLGKFATPISIDKWGTVARFWARYDEQYLYVAFRVNDASPALNLRQGEMRWEGDQVELCLCTDPAHHNEHGSYSDYDYQLFMGPTGDGTASVYVNINNAKHDYLVPGSQAAVQSWADKQGYDLEARVPWASLNRPAGFQPKIGLEIGWQIQVDFGPTDGGKIMGGVAYTAKWYPYGIHFQHPNQWAWARLLAPDETIFAKEPMQEKPREPVGKAELTFTTPSAGKVSINVMRADGTLVRRVVIGKQMDAGTHTMNWDGYDEDGKPAPAGDYRFVGSVSNIGVKYLATLGNSSPEPYGGCRKFVGGEYRHGAFTHVIMNPDGTFYMLNNGGEGSPSIQLIDPAHDFRVSGGVSPATAGSEFAVAGARDGEYLYFNHGATLSRFSEKTQQSVRFTTGAWSVNIADDKDGPALGLAACKGKVYVPLFTANRIDIYDGNSGGRTGSITAPGFTNPADVCTAPDGTLYVVDRLSVRCFTPDGKYLRTPVQGLTQGRAVAVGADGTIYVSDDGTHQVLVFESNGKLRKAFGPVGGATVRGKGPLNLWKDPVTEWVGGKLYPDRFFHPWGLGVDAQGNLVIVDQGNLRIQYFDKRGQLKKSIISQIYASLCVDPANPDTAFLCSEQGAIRQYRMDWKSGQHELVAQWAPTPTHFQYVKWHNNQPYFFSSRSPILTIENGKLRTCTDAAGTPLSFALWGHCFHVKDNWDIINQTGGGERDFVFYRYPFKGFDTRQNPIYGAPQIVFAGSKIDSAWTADLSGGKPRNAAVGGYDVADDGMTFLVLNDRPEFVPVDCRLRCYTPEGKRLWSIGQGTKGFWSKPGEEISFSMRMADSLDDFLFVGDTTGVIYVFNRNALYLGTLCEGGDWAPELKSNDPRVQPQGEMWWCQVFRDARTKRVYAIMMPNASPLVLTYEVMGLEQVKAITGSCTLTSIAVTAK